jgi:hypothetical protein
MATVDYPMMPQQGWQCPCCKAVYSPSTPMCFRCSGEILTKTTDNTEQGSSDEHEG